MTVRSDEWEKVISKYFLQSIFSAFDDSTRGQWKQVAETLSRKMKAPDSHDRPLGRTWLGKYCAASRDSWCAECYSESCSMLHNMGHHIQSVC